MRAELLQGGEPVGADIVAGRGERLSLRQGCVDVVWMSAVIHHLEDLARCGAEIRWVLAGDGAVVVRGLFADLGSIPGLELVPGSNRARAVFPSVAMIRAEFARQGLRLSFADAVEDAGPTTIGQAAERIRRLRHIDTLLRQFTDDEIARGLAAMDALDPWQPIDPAELGLLAFGP